MNARLFVVALVLVVTGIVARPLAWADPLPGEILKFQQLPLNNGAVPAIPPITSHGAPFPGHDELSTAILQTVQPPSYFGTYMADDFADKFETPVVHVRWWGSYLENVAGAAGVQDFLISFENDIPAGPDNPFSHPGSIKFNQIVKKGPLAPGSGTFTEKLIPTPVGGVPISEPLYEYNAELNLGQQFRQKPNTVYWLKIVALVDPTHDGNLQWGWHDRDWSIPDPLAAMPPAVLPGEGIVGNAVLPGPPPLTVPIWHFQDDAVTGPIRILRDPATPNMPTVVQDGWTPTHYLFPFDGPDVIQQFSKDLAFELYTRKIPEPASLALAALAAFAWCTLRRRRDLSLT